MPADALHELKLSLRKFSAERDWDKFHTPKNLAMALVVEAAEVAEHFQWSDGTAEVPADKRDAVAHEIGDTFIYLLRLADKLGVDLVEAAEAKRRINAERYPVEKVYGRALKYTEL